MALIKCPECGKEISDKASVCINCGYPISEYAEELKREEERNRIEQIKEQQEAENENSTGKTFSSEARKTNYAVEKPPFWKRGWFLTLMCIFIPPVGICLLLVAKKPSYAPIRTTLTVFLAMYAVVWCVAMFSDSDNTSTQADSARIEVAEQEPEKEVDSVEEKEEIDDPKTVYKEQQPQSKDDGEKPEDKYETGIEKYESGNYKYVSLDDLKRYYANMSGAKIYCVIEIEDITDEGIIQANLTDGYMFSKFTLKEKCEDIEVGQTVAILGKVSGYDDYGIAGNSINITGCYIFADGDDANGYKKEESDKSLEKYFEITKEVAGSGVDLNEDEYKEICEELNYEEIMRNPDSFDGIKCKISGKVSQIVEGWFDSYTIYIETSGGDIWGCTYTYKDGENRLLEGDAVTVYGECKGTDTTETVLGKQVTMPRVDIEYIN